ncbi:MAG TPA: hypothetical protein VK976_16460 [Verrucomicrobiae bacterium]|jgi:hypothetical protein|nr:hypothetical protein [Verrucomicrobiae bacterium]
MELHKSYIVLGLIIALVLFFGIVAGAEEPANKPKTGMFLTHEQRPTMPLLGLAAGRNTNGTRN